MATDTDQPGAPESPAPEASELQFDKVENAAPEAARACALCQRFIADDYFELGGRVICSVCANERGARKGGMTPLLRALVFGGLAALAGSIGWFLIVKITDYELGLIAVGVGLLVGLAVRRGARGRGGWKYQVLAMLLTYASITVSKVPFVLKELVAMGDRDAEKAKAAKAAKDGAAAQDAAGAAAKPKPAERKPPGLGEFLFAWLLIIGIALASPFLAGAQNFMGIIIIGIALYEAWKINKRIPLNGPFRMGLMPDAAAVPAGGVAPPPQVP